MFFDDFRWTVDGCPKEDCHAESSKFEGEKREHGTPEHLSSGPSGPVHRREVMEQL